MFIRLVPLFLVFALTACGGNDAKDHKDHDHKDHEHDKGHVHTAPHGGTLVELGDHFANVELKLDAELKTFSLYVLDAHAENAVKIFQPVVEIMMPSGVVIPLGAKANENTGEKVGDTSQFEIVLKDSELKVLTAFDGVIKSITVKNQTFKDVKFSFPASLSR
jgi:hypothetical protein